MHKLTSMSILIICILDQKSQKIHAQFLGDEDTEDKVGLW